MAMIKVRTSELSGQSLNWAVAMAEKAEVCTMCRHGVWFVATANSSTLLPNWYNPAIDSRADVIMDSEKIGTEWCWNYDEPCWRAGINLHSVRLERHRYGSTRREAAMRVFVASKIGDDVEIPGELIK